MSETISFAVIGCGRIGQRHIEMIKNLPAAELIAVCDVKPAADLRLPAEVPHYTSVEAMLAAHPSLDVVAIATPNGCHAQQALQVIAAGAHPIIEKPMALTRRDAEKCSTRRSKRGNMSLGSCKTGIHLLRNG
jgi:UDP-N-acetyl-2-amino-2-deoxyglucuronate dehydrogenase